MLEMTRLTCSLAPGARSMFNKRKLLVCSYNILTTCSARALDHGPWDITRAKHYSHLIKTQIIRMMMVTMQDA